MKSTKDIMYFSNEGKENMLETFKKAKERALELNIKKYLSLQLMEKAL